MNNAECFRAESAVIGIDTIFRNVIGFSFEYFRILSNNLQFHFRRKSALDLYGNFIGPLCISIEISALKMKIPK